MMYSYLLAFCVGALSVHFSLSSGLTSAFFLAFLGVFALFTNSWRLRRHIRSFPRQKAVFAIKLLALVVVGNVYASIQIQSHKSAQLPVNQTSVTKELEGRLCSIPVKTQYGERVRFCTRDGRISLSVPEDVLRFEAGMWWKGLVRLKAPRSSYNPWVSNYERTLFASRVVAMGSATSLTPVTCTFTQELRASVTRMRWHFHERLTTVMDATEHRGMIIALVLGHKSGIEEETAQVLRYSGTQHLMAISGLHVGIICWLVYGLAKRIRLPRLALGLTMSVGFLYIMLVGFSPSAQRAYIMTGCALLVLTGRIPGNLWHGFLLALFFVLLIDPLASLNAGFWFSFVAVFWLIWIYELAIAGRVKSVLASMLIAQLLLSLALSPIQSSFGFPVSAFSIFANLVAIPWVSVVILPLSLMSAVFAVISEYASSLFSVVNAVIDVLIAFLSIALDEPTTVFHVSGNVMAYLPFWFGLWVALCLIRIGFVAQAVLLVMICARLLVEDSVENRSSADTANFTVLDVGQGLSLVAHTKQSIWIYDTGPSFLRFSYAKSVLVPFVERHTARNADRYLIVSHGDADHSGDAAWTIARLRPQFSLLGEPERLQLPERSIVRACHQNQALSHSDGDLNRLKMEVIWPLGQPSDSTSRSQLRGNARSCVVRFEVNGRIFLVMGDLEGKQERDFVSAYLERNPSHLRADVLIAGHHGAKAASSMALLKRVRPSYVVFSAGYANRFGHPDSKVLDRVRRIGAKPLFTARSGAIRFEVDLDSNLKYALSRQEQKNYWISP